MLLFIGVWLNYCMIKAEQEYVIAEQGPAHNMIDRKKA